jgi:type I site-specific restriction endonuclease
LSRNEAQTRKDLIDPKLKEAGWYDEEWMLEWEYKITAGRINFTGRNAGRSKPKYADYLLRCNPSVAIALVEAKKEELSHLEGNNRAALGTNRSSKGNETLQNMSTLMEPDRQLVLPILLQGNLTLIQVL